ncbi:MAG: septal ring lytic transglycosylase RlpA family protein, partial [Methylobacter sp.]|nr:septal ring lytic transglycosylase RlpA family protein [Methylobacter sp.]
MNKMILAISVLFICSYLSTAQASEHRSSHKPAKHVAAKNHKSKPHSNKHQTTTSWYGVKFHGKKTASGQTFDMYAMTAAHKSLPLLSYVKVTNPKNHRSIVVRITDRGTFHGKREMDLSYAAAQKLGI